MQTSPASPLYFNPSPGAHHISHSVFQLWSDGLIKLAYSLAQLNGSAIMFLQKAHTKLCLQVDKTGRIPVKK